jgi:hypothetical protein
MAGRRRNLCCFTGPRTHTHGLRRPRGRFGGKPRLARHVQNVSGLTPRSRHASVSDAVLSYACLRRASSSALSRCPPLGFLSRIRAFKVFDGSNRVRRHPRNAATGIPSRSAASASVRAHRYARRRRRSSSYGNHESEAIASPPTLVAPAGWSSSGLSTARPSASPGRCLAPDPGADGRRTHAPRRLEWIVR